nr:Uma2 family endonuclease [Pleurocapsa sp. FMAR1]
MKTEIIGISDAARSWGFPPRPRCIKKRSEYAARGILEYWIVDPQSDKITILSLVDGFYEETVFEGDQAIASQVLKELSIAAAEILNFQ